MNRLKNRRGRILFVVATAALGGAAIGNAAISALGDPVARPVVATGLAIKADDQHPNARAAGLTPVTVEKLKLDITQLKPVAVFSTASGPHNVFVGPSTDGKTCLIDDGVTGQTPDGRPLRVSGGGCSENLFDKHPVAVHVGWSAGPDGRDRRALHLIGIAHDHVARLVVADSRGLEHRVALTPTHAFRFVMPPAALRADVQPVAIVSYDKAGAEIDRFVLN